MYVDLLFDPFGGRWTDVCGGAVAAERVGLDGVWLYDHLAGSVHLERHVLECWTTLTAIAAAVPRIAIGPGDGMNAPAGPHLGELVEMGRQAHARSGGDPATFIVTASGGPSPQERERLVELGVDRLIVYVAPPYSDGVARVKEALDR